MAWEKTITNKGLDLQAKILAGAPVIITRAAVGGNFVPSDQLAGLDDVTDYLSNVTVDVNPPEQIGGKAIIKTAVTNDGITTPINYYQVGVFAEDPDDGEILYLIAQDPTGNLIPSQTDTPEFRAQYDFEILVSLTSDITVQYDPTNRVTHEQLNSELEKIYEELGYKTPTRHKSPDVTFGVGDETNYGHLKADMDGTNSFSVQRVYLTETTINLSEFTNNSAKGGIYDFYNVTAFDDAPPDVNIPNPANGYITVHKNTDRTITIGVELHIHGYSTIWLWGGGSWSKVEGGGGGMNPTLVISTPNGSSVTVTKDGSPYTTFTADTTPTILTLTAFGLYAVTATLSGQTANGNVNVTQVQEYTLSLAYFIATLNVNTTAGATVNVTDGSHPQSGTANGNGVATFTINYPNTYNVTATLSGVTTAPVNVVINNSGQTYTANADFYKTFGVSIDLTNSNPESSVAYTDDAVGKTAGSSAWDSEAIFSNIKPCVLKNGVVQYYLNPADFTKKADNSAADITGNDGDVMIEIPKTGFQITTSGSTVTVKVTDDLNKAGFRYYAHSRTTEGDRQKLYIGAYKGQIVSSKLRSISNVTPTVSQTIGAFRTAAQANGSGYDLVSFHPLTLVQCLYLIRFKNLNSQAALGRGYMYSQLQDTGNTNAKGMFFGSQSTSVRVKCFGIEDLWGNICEWIDGLFCNASRNIFTAFTDFNDTGSGYTDRGNGGSADVGGWLSTPQGTTEAGFIAKSCSGSSTTYFADSVALNAGCLPKFGSMWSYTVNAGVFYLVVDRAASSANAGVGSVMGGRLMYL
jgi:hypothetical protein